MRKIVSVVSYRRSMPSSSSVSHDASWAADRQVSEPFIEAARPGIVVFDAERGEGQAAGTDALLANADEHRSDAQALQGPHHGQLGENTGRLATELDAAIRPGVEILVVDMTLTTFCDSPG